MRYLSFFDSDAGVLTDTPTDTGHRSDSHTLLDYSARIWDLLFREAGISDDVIVVRLALRISDPNSKTYLMWSEVHRKYTNPRFSAALKEASFFGHTAEVKLLLDAGADADAQG